MDTAHVAWSEFTGLCGFAGGSCGNGKWEASIMIKAFTKTLGWVPIYKKCGLVTGQSSLDADLGGCGMLKTCVPGWTRVAVDVSLFYNCIFRWNALHAGGPLPSAPNTVLWYGGLWLGCARLYGLGLFVDTRVRSFVCQTERHDSPLQAMHEIPYGTIWRMIRPMLTTDDAVMRRTVASRWNVVAAMRRWASSISCHYITTHTSNFGITIRTATRRTRC